MLYLQNAIQSKLSRTTKERGFFSSPLKSHSIALARVRKVTGTFMAIMLFLCVFAVPALASGGSGVSDPVDMLDKLKEYLFNALAAVGLILIGLGVVQVGLSFKSQDPSQRSVGLLCTFGGIMVAGVKFVVEAIGG